MLAPEKGLFGPDQPVSEDQFRTIVKQLVDKELTTGSEPVIRAAFAEALQSGGVRIDFASSEADKVRPITRSEAAQVIAEILEAQARGKMTSTPQIVAWKSVRPATPATLVVAEAFRRELQRLVDRKIIDSLVYWQEHAVDGQQCDGAKVATLIQKAAKLLEPENTGTPPVEVLARHNILGRVDYWTKLAQPGSQCGGTAVATLLGNLSRQLARTPSSNKSRVEK